MSSLRIVADANISFVKQAFGRLGTVDRYPGYGIDHSTVKDADVLLVRSVTPVAPPLLDGSSVRFVGSATIGTDHVDRSYLEKRGVSFAHAPGSNAGSVADYVIAALLALARVQKTQLSERTVGVVGCGNIGGRLVHRLRALGLSVLCNDPPRAEAENEQGGTFVPLGTVLRTADVISLHVPLTTAPPHSTHHLIDDEVLQRVRAGVWLVNTSRGAVVDGEALLRALERGRVGAAVLDVWEGEPTPDEDLVRAVDVATPHIAGYAYDGKVRGTVMLYEALCDYLEIEATWDPEPVLRPEHPGLLRCHPPDPRLHGPEWFHALAGQAYDIWDDDARMRRLFDAAPSERADGFRRLRSTYPTRREMQRYTIPAWGVPDPYRSAVEEGLTIQCR